MKHYICKCQGCGTHLIDGNPNAKDNQFFVSDDFYQFFEKTTLLTGASGKIADCCPTCETDEFLDDVNEEKFVERTELLTPFRSPDELKKKNISDWHGVFRLGGLEVHKSNIPKRYIYALNGVIFSELMGYNKALIVFILNGEKEGKSWIQKRALETLKKIKKIKLA
jgi:hypothetical protein